MGERRVCLPCIARPIVSSSAEKPGPQDLLLIFRKVSIISKLGSVGDRNWLPEERDAEVTNNGI